MWANLKQDLSQLEGVLAAIGTLQGVILPLFTSLPQVEKVASAGFGAISVLAICLQKITSA